MSAESDKNALLRDLLAEGAVEVWAKLGTCQLMAGNTLLNLGNHGNWFVVRFPPTAELHLSPEWEKQV